VTKNELPSQTHIGHVHLRISNLEDSLVFYRDLIGFKPIPSPPEPFDQSQALSATGESPVHLILTEHPQARPRPAHTTGLYHLAIRLPDRRALARLFQRIAAQNYPLQGFADHKVSEAIYLADPEGNGLEFYSDRPKEQWPKQGKQISMTTDPLDVDNLLAELAGDSIPWTGIDPGTDIGHIHLQVSDLSQAEVFYHSLIGLDVTQRSYPGALFFSAGGYHHHIGTNIWASRGASPPPPDAVGLVSYSLHLPTAESWSQLLTHLLEKNVNIEGWIDYDSTISALVYDPFGIGLELSIDRSLVGEETLNQFQDESLS
jgi:catechol 2,3-dioxygenase